MPSCPECVTVTKNNSVSCKSCKRSFHWECTGLKSFEIKRHKDNPYKPWICTHYKENSCFECNLGFPNSNKESICCDVCQHWYHLECSNLSEDDFLQFCDLPNLFWSCPSCKKKTCGQCNLSTYNKQKVNCIVCKDSFHYVCAGIPKTNSSTKMFDTENWICNSCVKLF